MIIVPQTLMYFADAASKAACSKNKFFIFDPWWKYLDVTRDNGICNVKFDFPYDLTLVGLALLDDALRLIGLVAAGYLIWGGIQYTTSQGEPDGIKRAQETILNALIGIVLALISIPIITFLGSQLG